MARRAASRRTGHRWGMILALALVSLFVVHHVALALDGHGLPAPTAHALDSSHHHDDHGRHDDDLTASRRLVSRAADLLDGVTGFPVTGPVATIDHPVDAELVSRGLPCQAATLVPDARECRALLQVYRI